MWLVKDSCVVSLYKFNKSLKFKFVSNESFKKRKTNNSLKNIL